MNKETNIPFLVALGAEIKHRREEAGLSQEGFAFKSGLHRTYISEIERGNRNISISNLRKVAGALDIPLSELFRSVNE